MSSDDDGGRLDRELIELLNELRVVLPGVQVLFAFLLTVPFTARFEEVTTSQRGAFFVAFAATALASALLMAPSAHHRLLWRLGDKERLLRRANLFAICGLVCLVVALTSATYLIADVVYGTAPADVAAAGLAAVMLTLWFVVPLVRRVTLRRH